MDVVIQSFTVKYAKFSGRAPRKEYWLFLLGYVVLIFAFSILDVATGFYDIGLFRSVFFLAALLPLLAVSVRRMHDTDRVGWWLFITLVPLVGTIWYFILTLLRGTSGENRFGPDPYGAVVDIGVAAP